MRQGKFEITPELLARIQKIEVFVGGEPLGEFTDLTAALKEFMRETSKKLYQPRNFTWAKKLFLPWCYWKVYYQDGKIGTWDFWTVMTATKKYQKNLGFQKVHLEREQERFRGSLRRAKAKGIMVP